MADEEVPFVRITNREIWDSIQGLERTVSAMDNRLNSILNENVELRSRVRALELKTYALLAGVATGLGSAGLIALKGVFRYWLSSSTHCCSSPPGSALAWRLPLK